MQSKFFTRASRLAALVPLLSAVAASAQAPGPSASPRAKVGYIRFWDMLPPANGTFVLRKPGTPGPNDTSLTATAYQYRGYGEFPPGRIRLSVFKNTEPNNAIKTVDIDLKADTFFTVLVAPQPSGAGNVEVINDTIVRSAPPGTLSVRNFFPGLTVSVKSASAKIADGISYGQSYTAEGLGSAILPLALATRLPDGTPAESTAEADFRHARRATLLIIPDSYGRFRPRVVSDGVAD